MAQVKKQGYWLSDLPSNSHATMVVGSLIYQVRKIIADGG